MVSPSPRGIVAKIQILEESAAKLVPRIPAEWKVGVDSTLSLDCGAIDTLFLLDGSGSITDHDFISMLDATARLAGDFEFGEEHCAVPRKAQQGVIQFSGRLGSGGKDLVVEQQGMLRYFLGEGSAL